MPEYSTTTRVCATCSRSFSLIPGQPVWLDGTVCSVECIPYIPAGKYPPEYIERYTRKQPKAVESSVPQPERASRLPVVQPAPEKVDRRKHPRPIDRTPLRLPVIDRTDRVAVFWSMVDKSAGDNGCWIWRGGKTGMGYGAFLYQDKQWGTHRLAWVLTNGRIDDSLSICHNCPGGDTPLCCNPAHMFVDSHKGNMQDYWSKRKAKIAKGIPVKKTGRPRTG